MGASPSSFAFKKVDPGQAYAMKHQLSAQNKRIADLMMPVYYCNQLVTTDDIAVAKRSWNMILQDTSPEFLRRKQTDTAEQFPYDNCITLFYDKFYSRLFDIHPLCKPMFQGGLKSQGKFLVKLIGFAVSLVDNQEKFEEILVKLAEAHNARGVKAVEYGIVGEVLFWTLRQCLGDDVYDRVVAHAWVKIFSRMLKVIIPVALAYEIENGEAQIERLRTLQQAAKEQRSESQSSTSVSISVHPI